LSFGTLLMVLRGRSTRSTLNDFMVLRFFPASLFLHITSPQSYTMPVPVCITVVLLCVSTARLN